MLTQQQRDQFVEAIKRQADTNRAILEQLGPPPNVEHKTVIVSERRLKQIKPLPFMDRRKGTKNVS